MLQMGTHKHEHSQHGKDALVAGVTGLLVGAAGVTALVLSDEDLRKRVHKRAKELRSNLQDWSAEKLQMIDHKTVKEETVKKTEKVIDDTKEDEPLKEVSMNN